MIPWPVKDIEGEEPELGDRRVYSPVGKSARSLKPFDVIPQFLPGDICGIFMKDPACILEVGTDIGGVGFQRVGGKTPEGDHFPVDFKVIHEWPPKD